MLSELSAGVCGHSGWSYGRIDGTVWVESYLSERRLDGAIYVEAMGERKGGVTCYKQTVQS